MSTARPRNGSPGASPETFVVYVEGPRDGDILRSWARQVWPDVARRLVDATVILGGRRPARALAHLRDLVAQGRCARGLCVLDRDVGDPPDLPPREGVELELFTWSRRHIESYLLVPEAIRRGLRLRGAGAERALRAELPEPDDEAALLEIDAKRLLDRRGPVSRLIGRPVDLGRIARAMRPEEIHPDVHELIGRMAGGFGLRETEVVVTVWAGRASSEEPAV